MKPYISAIIPVYNGRDFLPEAVESILSQDYEPLEILIIDDGSTDGTAELKDSFGQNIRFLSQSNQGPAAARNKGIEEADGELIAFLDSDDLWALNKLNLQAEVLMNAPNFDIILGYTKRFKADPVYDSSSENPIISVQLGSALFRKSVFDKVGLFDESLRFSEDHDWFLRAREKKIPMQVIKEVTLYHRRHPNNLTVTHEAHGYQLTEVLKKSLDRRRQQCNGDAASLPKLSDYLKKND